MIFGEREKIDFLPQNFLEEFLIFGNVLDFWKHFGFLERQKIGKCATFLERILDI